MNNIPFVIPSISNKEKEYVLDALSKGNLAGNNEYNKKCQLVLEQYTGTPKALMVTSCTSGLEMAAILSDIEPGDEVIMPSFTFVSTANAFGIFGGIPVFVDIRPDTLNLNEQLIEQAITNRTRAIVPVHYAGVSCEMDTINAIAKKHGLTVIEDAAQGMGAKYKSKHLGTLGNLASVSFHQTKNVTSGGEGGAIFINDPKLIDRAEIVLEKGTNRKQFFQGLVDKYTWVDKGSSFVTSELNAAFMLAQLERLDDINQDRMIIWNMYHSAFEELESKGYVQRPTIPSHCEHNAHIYYLLLNTPQERNDLLQYLKKENIGAVFHYIPLHSSPGGKQFGKIGSSMNVTDKVHSTLIRLPLYAGITQQEATYIIKMVNSFFSK